MIGEIIDKQDKTKLIEMQKVKLIIEDWRDYKFILLSSSYEEKFRENLKMFARTFMNKYPEEIKKFAELSISPTFSYHIDCGHIHSPFHYSNLCPP